MHSSKSKSWSKCSVAKVNSDLSDQFDIAHCLSRLSAVASSVCIGTRATAVEVGTRDTSFELGEGKAVSASMDDVTIMMSDASEVVMLGTILREYE